MFFLTYIIKYTHTKLFYLIFFIFLYDTIKNLDRFKCLNVHLFKVHNNKYCIKKSPNLLFGRYEMIDKINIIAEVS